MRTLEIEFLRAMDGLDDIARCWLVSQGVSPGIIEVSPGPITTATIEADELGCFQFAEFGKVAFIHPVTVGGPFTDIADLIAWFPDKPHRWWLLLGNGYPLGVDMLNHAKIEGLPLAIRRSPLSWLQAGGDGVVVTDWAISAPALRHVDCLDGEDEDHAAEIYRHLNNPQPVPEIRYAKGAA